MTVNRNFYLRTVCHFQVLIFLLIFKDHFYNVTNKMFSISILQNSWIITKPLKSTSFFFKCFVPHCFMSIDGQCIGTELRDRHNTEKFQFGISSHSCVLFFLCCNSQTRVQVTSFLRSVDLSLSLSHTHTHTHIHDKNPLNDRSAPRRRRYLHNTQQAQQTNIYSLRGI